MEPAERNFRVWQIQHLHIARGQQKVHARDDQQGRRDQVGVPGARAGEDVSGYRENCLGEGHELGCYGGGHVE